MLHQALISYSPSPLSSPRLLFASSPSAASTTCLPTFVGSSAASVMRYPHGQCSVVGTEGRMEALRNGFRPQEAAEEAAPAAWGLPERGGLLGEGFSVEDLLDLEELCEADRDGGDQGEAPAVEEEEKSNDSHGSSVVSYELMPPPPPPPPPEIDLPAHDAEELEWVSRFIDDSLTELPPLQPAAASAVAARPPQPPAQHQQAAAHPSRSSTICALSTESLVPVKAKRSRRTRAAVWTLSGSHPFSDSTSSSSTTTTSSCSSSASFSSFLLPDTFAAFDLLDDLHLPPPPKKSKNGKNSKHKPKKRGRKPKHPPPHLSGAAAAAALPASGDRRCSHCGVQKTPQWRAGPEGAKTLCNACGVRYKSGRLLPEYRPACSPTFVSSLHSNSHRKVLEMRRKKEAVLLPAAVPAVASF